MNPEQFVAGLSWTVVVTAVVTAYAVSIAVYLVLENRSPQSTFAWLFLLLLFPFGGLVVYVLFGRSWHAFSRARVLTKLMEGSKLADRSARLIEEQPAKFAALASGPRGEYARLGTMRWAPRTT